MPSPVCRGTQNVKGGPIPSHKIDNVFALLDAMWAFDLSEGQVSE